MANPQLDVTEIIGDPDFAESFTVLRRSESVNQYGQSVVTSQNLNAVGVVCQAGPNDLERLDDNQRMGRHISVVTMFRLRGPASGYQPDVILWNGNNFVVQQIDDYANFGQGFIEAIAGSMDSMDVAPT